MWVPSIYILGFGSIQIQQVQCTLFHLEENENPYLILQFISI